MSDPRPQIVSYTIEESKLGGYLLDLGHPDGGPKAALFLTHNFTAESLRPTLIDHVRSADFHRHEARPFGYVFEVRGGVLTPINQALQLRAIWAVDDTAPSVARFVTAYPV